MGGNKGTVITMVGFGAFLTWGLAKLGGQNNLSGAWMPPSQHGLAKLRGLCAAASIPEEWTQILGFIAYGESGWNNLVGLGMPELFPDWAKPNRKASSSAQAHEAAAARKAWERNQERFAACGHPPEAYWFGSGGWFGLLPANGLAKLDGTGELGCLPPSTVFDPAVSILMACGFARALMGWEGFREHPTRLNLRVGWGNPSAMGDHAILTAKRPRYEKHRKACKLPPGWLDQRIGTPPPVNFASMLSAMKAIAA